MFVPTITIYFHSIGRKLGRVVILFNIIAIFSGCASSGVIPMDNGVYYISKSNMKSELAEEKAPHSYTEIVTESTIKRNRSAIGERTAWEVWTQEKDNLMKAIRLLGCMPEEKIDVNQYRSILQAIFTENNNILSSLDSPNRSNLHRMIRIYDFLEYGQKKTP